MDMNVIKAAICDVKVNWIRNATNDAELRFAHHRLSLVAKMWFYFISYQIRESNSLNFVQRDKALVVYTIMTGMPVNIGNLIRQRDFWIVEGPGDLCFVHPI
ncbi:hypothetical protein ACH5RR_015636 [Cinchona calisaya]|uniref:Putative plant transposon protein domain-containing protein n=1 Tax=Cinchona calisaya TaxID=153742 RepID=A0ABD2ZWE0_9GENT